MAIKQTLVPVLVLLLSAVLVRAEIIEQILVKINGEIFTKTDLENIQVQTLRQRGQQFDLKSEQADAKGVNVGKDDDAKAKAEQIRGRALAGESFEKLASDLSESPSRSNAGLIGPISVKDLSPDFQKLVSSMKPGDITEPLRSQRGYQILKLESSTGAQTLPFEQAREQIGDRVFTDKRQAEFQKYLERLRGEAIIEWKNPEIKTA